MQEQIITSSTPRQIHNLMCQIVNVTSVKLRLCNHVYIFNINYFVKLCSCVRRGGGGGMVMVRKLTKYSKLHRGDITSKERMWTFDVNNSEQ